MQYTVSEASNLGYQSQLTKSRCSCLKKYNTKESFEGVYSFHPQFQTKGSVCWHCEKTKYLMMVKQSHRVKDAATAKKFVLLTKISFKAAPRKNYGNWPACCIMLWEAILLHCSLVSTNVEYMKRSAECEVAKSVWPCGDDWSQVKRALTGRRGWRGTGGRIFNARL